MCPDRLNMIAVSNGYYSPAGSSMQYICPAGYSCSNNILTQCTAGQYSNDGDLNCNICPVGWACPDITNSDSNINCANLPGFYQDQAQQTQCKICQAGYYCPGNNSPPIACSPGSFSQGGQTSCTPCPAGYGCPSTSLPLLNRCLLGTYSIGNQQ